MTWHHYTFPDPPEPEPVRYVYADLPDLPRPLYRFVSGGGYAWNVFRPLVVTPAELEAERQRRGEYEREYLERVKQRQAAEAKARELLLSRLTEEQKGTLERENWFAVRGSKGNQYTIGCMSTTENVYRTIKGRIVTYCAGLVGVPQSDFWLAQKLLIESDEDAFLKVAIASY